MQSERLISHNLSAEECSRVSAAHLLVIHRVCLQYMVQRLLACTLRLLIEDVGWIRSVEISSNLIILLANLHCQQFFIHTYVQITQP